jgi:hypothetical protein
VVITGSLDPKLNQIHVQKIELDQKHSHAFPPQ